MSGPKIPKVPSASETAQNTFNTNKKTLAANVAANRVDQDTQFGNMQWTQVGTDAQGNPQYSLTSRADDSLQPIIAALTGATGNIGNAIQANYTGLPDFSEAAGTQTRLNMERYANYTNPIREQQYNQLDNQLRNQGLMPGTTAYDNAIRTLRDTQARETDLALAGYQNNAFNQAQQQYQQPITNMGQMLQTLFSTDPAQRFSNVPQVNMAQTDYAGIQNSVNQANMARYQAQLAQHNAMLTGITGIGSTLLGAPKGGNFMSGLFG